MGLHCSDPTVPSPPPPIVEMFEFDHSTNRTIGRVVKIEHFYKSTLESCFRHQVRFPDVVLSVTACSALPSYVCSSSSFDRVSIVDTHVRSRGPDRNTFKVRVIFPPFVQLQ